MDVKDEPDIDDEFALIGSRDPKICITTSRDPSSKLKQFSKEIKICIPNSQSINRVNETRGVPDGLVISHLPFGPTVYFGLSNTVLRHDIPDCKPASQIYPHIILENFSTKIGKRIGKAIQALHHIYKHNKNEIELEEIGPRYEMRPYEIRLGTIDQEEAEREWVLRSFTNTARNKVVL
eukprot:gene20299-26350_t